jgi:hypothetical protein
MGTTLKPEDILTPEEIAAASKFLSLWCTRKPILAVGILFHVCGLGDTFVSTGQELQIGSPIGIAKQAGKAKGARKRHRISYALA